MPFLEVALSSFIEHHPSVKAHVLLGQVSGTNRALLHSNFPQVNWLPAEDFGNVTTLGPARSIAYKVGHWQSLLGKVAEGELVFFLDVDTLTRGPADSLLPDVFDVCFTYKAERWPLNTGVVVVRNSPVAREFIKSWARDSTELARASEAEILHAEKVAGAIDQFTFLRRFDSVQLNQDSAFPLSPGPYESSTEKGVARLVGLPCELFNQTNSVSEGSPAVIIHYKGSMSRVIDDDGEFNPIRNRQTSEDIYAIWEQKYESVALSSSLNFLKDAYQALDKEEVKNLSIEEYENRGILNSEAAFVVGLVRRLGVDCVVESGRARGRSTFLMAKYLPDTEIISIENSNDSDAQFGIVRLRGFKNVRLVQGDAKILVPTFVRESLQSRKKVALIIDGPKGYDAVRLLENVIKRHELSFAAIHDMNLIDTRNRGKPNIPRYVLQSAFDRVIFSDHPELCAGKDGLDSGHRPYRMGAWHLGSYGPTFGFVFPTWRDSRRQNSKKLLRRFLRLLRRLARKTRIYKTLMAR